MRPNARALVHHVHRVGGTNVVTAAVGVVSVKFWIFCAALGRGGGGGHTPVEVGSFLQPTKLHSQQFTAAAVLPILALAFCIFAIALL